MGVDARSLGGDFRGPHGAGNLRIKHLDAPAVGIADQRSNFPGVGGSRVHHGHEDAVDLQPRVDLPMHLGDGLQQLLQTLGGKVVGLHRDDDPIRCRKGVDGQHAQRRHAVDEDVIIRLAVVVQHIFQRGLAAHGVDQGHLHAGQRNVRRQDTTALRRSFVKEHKVEVYIGDRTFIPCVRQNNGQSDQTAKGCSDGR